MDKDIGRIPTRINEPKLYPILPKGETFAVVVPFFLGWIITGGLYGVVVGSAVGMLLVCGIRKFKEKNSNAIAEFRYWYLPTSRSNRHLLDSCKREYLG